MTAGDPPTEGAWHRAFTSDFAKLLAKAVVAALVAGVTAGFGFWTTWQGLQAQVSRQGQQIELAETVNVRQDMRLDLLAARQNASDLALAVAIESMKSIDARLKDIREEQRDLRRDLTGRTSR